MGEIIIKKLRDENFHFYLERKKYASSLTINEYHDQKRNQNYSPVLQKNNDCRNEQTSKI